MKNTLIQRHSNWASDANGIVEDFLNATGKSIPQTIGLNVQGAKKYIALREIEFGGYNDPQTNTYIAKKTANRGDFIVGKLIPAEPGTNLKVLQVSINHPMPVGTRKHPIPTMFVKEFSPTISNKNISA